MAADITQNINYNYKSNVQTLTRYHDRFNASLGKVERTTQRLTRAIGSKDAYALKSEKITTRNVQATEKLRTSHKNLSGGMGGLALRFVGYQLILNQVMGMQQKLIEFTKESISKYREFENAVAEVSTILTTQTMDVLPSLRAGMENLSTTFGKAAVDMAKATYQILSAAFDADEAMQLLTIATKGAVAGLATVRTSVDILTSILNAYGQQASQAARISDYLFQTVVRGKLVYEDFASALGYITPIAANNGIEFKELAAVMSTATRMGLHLDMTVRGLALQIQGMVNPTEKVRKAAKKYGVELGALELRIFGLRHMFQQLHDASEEYGDHVIGQLVPNMRATRVAAALAGDEGIAGLAEDMDLLTESAGRTDEAMSKIVSTTKFMSDQLTQAMEQIKRDFGESMTFVSLEWERTKQGILSGLGSIITSSKKFGSEWYHVVLSAVAPIVGIGSWIWDRFKEGADASNKKIRESFNATAEFVKNTLLSTIEGAQAVGRKSLFEGLLGEDVDINALVEDTERIADIMGRISVKEKIANEIDALSGSLEAAKNQFIWAGGGANAYANYMQKVIKLNQEYNPRLRVLQSELLITENAWNDVTGALASFAEEEESILTAINQLRIALSDLDEEVGEVGDEYDGTLGIQLKFKEDVTSLEDKIRALQNAIKGNASDTKLLSDAMTAHIAKIKEQKDAYDDLRTAMSKNRLEIMKLEYKGMLRRRGLLRSEQQAIKKYQIENKELTIKELEMKLEEEAAAGQTSKEILNTELYALREQLREMKDTRHEDIQNLRDTIAEKETEIEKWTNALAAQQAELESMTEIHTEFINSLYTNMTASVLAEFERLSGYDLSKIVKEDISDILVEAGIKEKEEVKEGEKSLPEWTPPEYEPKPARVIHEPEISEKDRKFYSMPYGLQMMLTKMGYDFPTPKPSAAEIEKIEEMKLVLDKLGIKYNAPKYKDGISYVPKTQLAEVHRGERIIPAGANAGGDVYQISISVNATITDDYDVDKLGARLGATMQTQIADKRGKSKYRMR